MRLIEATNTRITRSFFEKTRNRYQLVEWIKKYNNCSVRNSVGDAIGITATPFVIMGSGGILENGFDFELVSVKHDGSWWGFVRRSPKIQIED